MKNMKHALWGTLAAVGCICAATSASAQGPYFSFGGGLNQPEDSSVNYTIPSVAGTTTPAETTFDMGYILSGALGYRFDNGFRTEAEFNYRQAAINDLAGAGSPGRQKAMSAMGNLLYDFGDYSSFKPYIGGGAGYVWNKWKNVAGNPSATFPLGTPNFSDRDGAFQWQAIGGVSRPFSERTEGFIEYRYIGTINNRFQSVTPGAAIATSHDDRSHNLLVGVRINFGT
jgi:OOP family OmpA-OmpF porin